MFLPPAARCPWQQAAGSDEHTGFLRAQPIHLTDLAGSVLGPQDRQTPLCLQSHGGDSGSGSDSFHSIFVDGQSYMPHSQAPSLPLLRYRVLLFSVGSP